MILYQGSSVEEYHPVGSRNPTRPHELGIDPPGGKNVEHRRRGIWD